MKSDSTGIQTMTAASIVASLGIILAVMAVSGQANNYLQPTFRPWILATGLALLGLALWTLWELAFHLPSASADNPMRPSAWMLLVPLMLATLSAPDPLGAAVMGSTAVGGAAGTTSASTARQTQQRQMTRVGRNADGTIAYPPLGEDTNEVTLEELAQRFTFGSKPELEGKTVRVVGFVTPADDGGWRVSRFKIYCCAADAIPYMANIADAPAPPVDTWVDLVGTVDTRTSPDNPVIHVTQLKTIPQPKIPYL